MAHKLDRLFSVCYCLFKYSWPHCPALDRCYDMSLHPQILWAQREKELLLTVAVEDMKVEDLSFKDKTFHIKGTNANGSQQYEASLELFEELDPDSLRKFPTTRQLEMVIDKKNPDWWPRLTSAKGKCAWVKVDFNKWKDEDDEDVNDVSSMDTGNFDMSSLLGGGMGGMGGLGDLSGLGGAGGDLSDLGGDELDYDTDEGDDMPPLEAAEETSEAKP
uniref:CS domain-containing protein n=1 Tax=Steinernema glaseri TaxID=37863 RepID=A0A1I7Y253_9BILA